MKIRTSTLGVLVGASLGLASVACVGLPPLGPGSTDGSTAEQTAEVDTTGSPSPGPADTTETGRPDAACGNGRVDDDEECDLGVDNGAGLECTADCRLNVCGDGYVGPGEACDDGNDDDFDDCSSQCGPPMCGDGVVTAAEECDEGAANDPNGSCLPSCQVATCGDALIHTGVELCDGVDVGDQSCRSKGFESGTLVCANDCSSYDVSGCATCGNGMRDGSEECDGAVPEDLSCEDFVPPGAEVSGGALACANTCTIDDGPCTFCGDGARVGGEACEGEDFGARTCASELGEFFDGALGCSARCEVEFDDCCAVGGGPCDSSDDCCVGRCVGGTCDAV